MNTWRDQSASESDNKSNAVDMHDRPVGSPRKAWKAPVIVGWGIDETDITNSNVGSDGVIYS